MSTAPCESCQSTLQHIVMTWIAFLTQCVNSVQRHETCAWCVQEEEAKRRAEEQAQAKPAGGKKKGGKKKKKAAAKAPNEEL